MKSDNPSDEQEIKSFCTDTGPYKKVKNRKLRKAYKLMATGRICKKTIAQLIKVAEFTTDWQSAFNMATHLPHSMLSEQETTVAQYCYNIAETNYIAKLHKLLITDDKAHSAMKVVADLKGLNKESAKDTDLVVERIIYGKKESSC